MKLSSAVLCLTLVASPAFALGRGFDEALSADDASRLLKNLNQLQDTFDKAAPAMEKLKKEPEVLRSPQLTHAATQVLKSHATLSVFLTQIRDGLQRRDAKVNAYELELKSEIDVFARRLTALRERARAEALPQVQQVVSQVLPVTTELAAQYLVFDANYLVATSDVDLLTIPQVDVFASVKFQNPYLAAEEGARFDTARAE
jgi:hypothetical protein